MRIDRGIGTGWVELAKAAERELVDHGYTGELIVSLTADGLLRLGIQSRSYVLRRIVACYEDRALRICERCGGDGRIRAGVVLRVLCRNCD